MQAGDIAGLELLVTTYQLQAARAAFLVVRDRSLAQDVVQTAFVRAFERIAQFDITRPFAPWFLRLVLNDAIKVAGRRAREATLQTAPEPTDPSVSPERDIERAETADEVWSALAHLTPAQRAAIVQRYYLGLSEAEMSAALGSPPSTVKARLHAARERLRSLLRPPAHDMEIT